MLRTVFLDIQNSTTSIEKDFLKGLYNCIVYLQGEDIVNHGNSIKLMKRLYHQNNKINIILDKRIYKSGYELFKYAKEQYKVKLILEIDREITLSSIKEFNIIKVREDLVHLNIVKKFMNLPNKQLIVTNYSYDKDKQVNIRPNKYIIEDWLIDNKNIKFYPDIYTYLGVKYLSYSKNRRLRLFDLHRTLFISMDTNKARSIRSEQVFNIDENLEQVLKNILDSDESIFKDKERRKRYENYKSQQVKSRDISC